MRVDKWVKRWVVPSSSGHGKHIVAQDAEGKFACDCIGWTRHVPRRDCKHILEVRLKEAGQRSEAELLTDAVFATLKGVKF